MKTKSLIIIFYVILCSCSSNFSDTRIKISGYSIGDSIYSEIDTIKLLDKPFIRAADSKEKRLELFLINNYIINISYRNLTMNEIEYYKNFITKKLGKNPKYSKNITASGITFYGEEYYWYDSISGDDISIWISNNQDNNPQGIIYIENEKISTELYRKFYPNYYNDFNFIDVIDIKE